MSFHQKQLRQLTTEIYKSLTDLSPEFIKLLFTVKEIPYDLHNGYILNLPSARTAYYDTNSVFFSYLVCHQTISSSSSSSSIHIHDFSERSLFNLLICQYLIDWLMPMNYFNLLFSTLELQTLPKMDCKFIINEPFGEYILTNFYGVFF